ncbi:hypothetical protein ECZU50_48060 [Escherichia coli]|nr:hypothetical protein ECZU50_48060 [Escherichia coli]
MKEQMRITLIILERNISVLPLMFMIPGTFYRLHKNRENLNITLSDFELEQIISGMRLKALASLVPLEKYLDRGQ